MFFQKIPSKLPKIYCKITFHSDYDNIGVVEFYGLLSYNSLNRFTEKFKGEGLKSFNLNNSGEPEYIDLNDIYNFLANENFIPISDTFFYRDMEEKDQLGK